MGKVAMVSAALVLATAVGVPDGAGAQRVVRPGPVAVDPSPGVDVYYPPLPQPPVQRQDGGRWWGGADAPGGWAAYRPAQRGRRLPRYWVAPRFQVDDWNSHGLPAPRGGQYWTRYYDDAVLIDGRGEVIDTVGAVDWDRLDAGGERSPRDARGGIAASFPTGARGPRR